MSISPDYYRQEDGTETIDRIRADGDAFAAKHCPPMAQPVVSLAYILGYCLGCARKYRDRAGRKPGNTREADLAKADMYDRFAEYFKGGQDPRSKQQ